MCAHCNEHKVLPINNKPIHPRRIATTKSDLLLLPALHTYTTTTISNYEVMVCLITSTLLNLLIALQVMKAKTLKLNRDLKLHRYKDRRITIYQANKQRTTLHIHAPRVAATQTFSGCARLRNNRLLKLMLGNGILIGDQQHFRTFGWTSPSTRGRILPHRRMIYYYCHSS